ncbi:MAG: ferritin-like domain-containing protein [Myxococcota bacterium]
MNATSSPSPLVAPRAQRQPSEQLDSRCPTAYVWSYETVLADLRALYEKAKGEQWDGRTYLPWESPVDPENDKYPDWTLPIYGTHIWQKLDKKEIRRLRRHSTSWTLSQFLHGEQGALLATAQIATTVPWIDAKLYAATQVMDEARHVEVYERYLREKIELTYPINQPLRRLLDQILCDPRWDMKYLGMQILVEGLALAAFRLIHDTSDEPLIRALTHNVMRDEARHVAFGVLSLRHFYASELSEAERREREEFTYEACRMMRDRFLMQEVWETLGLPVAECMDFALHSPSMRQFRKLLFARIVPNVKRLGLLSPFLRERFEELGILEFEHAPADG